jgi:hypothetical protein
MLPLLLVIVVVVAAGLVVVIALRPGKFLISRSTAIDAPAAVIFPYLSDFQKFLAWSPFDKLDPKATRDFSGPASGRGSLYSWDGNRKVGSGSCIITDCKQNELVIMRLDFIRPFKCTNIGEFKLVSTSTGVEVTWNMTGEYNFVMKAFGLVANMDKVVGGQFAQGLANLKTIAEGQAN